MGCRGAGDDGRDRDEEARVARAGEEPEAVDDGVSGDPAEAHEGPEQAVAVMEVVEALT